MYTYEQRMKAVELYIKYEHRAKAVSQELGYPHPNLLSRWYKEYLRKTKGFGSDLFCIGRGYRFDGAVCPYRKESLFAMKLSGVRGDFDEKIWQVDWSCNKK